MHKISQYIESYHCIENLYGDELTKEAYQILVVASISLSGCVFGFIATQSELILNSIGSHTYFSNQAYITSTDDGDGGLFAQKFTNVFMTGQVLGCIVSFILNDTFDRLRVHLDMVYIHILECKPSDSEVLHRSMHRGDAGYSAHIH